MIFILLRLELLALILNRSQCYGRGCWKAEKFIGNKPMQEVKGTLGVRDDKPNTSQHFNQPQQQNVARHELQKLSVGGISTMKLSAEDRI